nr:hypothetical protein [Tanacetum cinerariifolium]
MFLQEQENVVIEEVHMTDDDNDGTEFIDSGIQSIGSVTLESLNQDTDDSPFDTESKIKVVKKFKPVTDDEESLFTSKESYIEEDSELASIPDDEIESPSAFQTSDTDESLSEPKLSKSKEKDANDILDELANLQASVDKPTDNLSHLQEDIISLSTKVDQMESKTTKKGFEEIQSSVPGEKNEEKPNEVNIQEEQRNKKPEPEDANIQGELNAEKINTESAMIVHCSKEKGSEKKTVNESDFDDEPIAKRLKSSKKGKEIATKEEPLKQLIPFLEQGGSDPEALNLQQFSTHGKEMTLEEAHEQMMINIEAQKVELAEYEAKRAKMLADYKHYINFRAYPRRITKINYMINRVTRDATMRIERDNQPLRKSKACNTLLRSLKENYKWVKTQAGKLGLSPPPELTEVGLTPFEKKRKRTSEMIQPVFVTQDIKVPRMERNLIPPQGVDGSPGLVITEPEAGIFYYNGNFDLVFQRENKFHLATTAQLIRKLNTSRGTLQKEERWSRSCSSQ